MRRKARLAAFLNARGLLQAVLAGRRKAGLAPVAVLTYHHIADPQADSPLDPMVADATDVQFDRQMALLRAHCSPISMDDFCRALRGAPLPPNPVMVTFDDGYRSNHDVALPILRRYDIPAVFFVATEYISSRRLYWWESLAMMVTRAPRRLVDIHYPLATTIDLDAPTARTRLGRMIKDTRGLNVDRFLTHLATAAGLEWNADVERTIAEPLLMSWDHLRALAKAGMSIESHGHRHRVITTIDEAALHEELTVSKATIEREVGNIVRAIAYPVGYGPGHEPRLRQAVAAAGYEVGFTNATGVNWTSRGLDPFNVHRLATDRELTDAMFLSQLAIPGFAYTEKMGG